MSSDDECILVDVKLTEGGQHIFTTKSNLHVKPLLTVFALAIIVICVALVMERNLTNDKGFYHQ